jgi:L-threonylcarbamoyladenylate synthase
MRAMMPMKEQINCATKQWMNMNKDKHSTKCEQEECCMGMSTQYDKAAEVLVAGGLAVMPSDTIYGIFCDAHNLQAIEHLYVVRKRDTHKPCIVMIESIDQLSDFNATISHEQKNFLIAQSENQPTTFILEAPGDHLEHIHRKCESIGFRIPCQKNDRGRALLKVIKKTGPLLAPSANPAGQEPAQTTSQAKKYFGDTVGFYIDYGEPLTGHASQIIDMTQGNLRRLR